MKGLNDEVSFDLLNEIEEINDRVKCDISKSIKKTKKREAIEKDFMFDRLSKTKNLFPIIKPSETS